LKQWLKVRACDSTWQPKQNKQRTSQLPVLEGAGLRAKIGLKWMWPIALPNRKAHQRNNNEHATSQGAT
jgi:hypothetical protein